jgi:hypothetical protein
VAEAVDTGRLVKVGMLRAVIPTATSTQNGCSWAQAGVEGRRRTQQTADEVVVAAASS